MREIKFRAWNIKGKVMSQPFTLGDLFGYEGETNNVSLAHPYGGEGQTPNFIICDHDGGNPSYPQLGTWNGINPNLIFILYTGRKDKNGKEIYEGDIISMPFNRYPQNWQVGELTEYGLTFRRITNKPFPAPYQYRELRHFNEAEVIGNIYENPELLKGTE